MTRFRFLRTALLACGLVVCAASAQAQQYDDAPQANDASQPADTAQVPGRVARLAYSSGQVQFAPAGETDWGTVDINRPMVIGDRLLTGDDGRAVLELGDASVRLDHDSAFDFLNLDQGNVQIELSQGTLNLAVRQLDQGENFEVDTPTVAFVAATPGVYRIDNSPNGTGSMVTVFQGSGTVYGENGASRNVAAGSSYRFDDSTLAQVDTTGLPQADDFDRFCESRDQNVRRYADQQQQYVPSDMIGADDLDEYGSWNQVPEYGNVWYPTSVPSGWAPYRYGHWAWIEPWGWTWVDDQRWGFAPFHYGRWAYIGNRWGWMPGPVNVRAVYAPALVAFIGSAGLSVSINLGGGGPVGWFPLGPRDVYVPWFHASRHYFTQVNVTNIRNTYVNRTVINNFYVDYSHGRAPRHTGHDYAYRNLPGAVTAVPRNVFTGARPVHAAALRLDRNQLARAEVTARPGVNPGKTSLGVRQSTVRPAVLKNREAFQRPVVARHAPPPRPVAFSAREKVIASQHGQPLTPAQLQNLRRARPAATTERNDRVKLVAPRVGAAAAGAGRPANIARGAAPQRNQPAPTPTPTDHTFHNQIHPIPAKNQPQPLRPGELRSSRFRQPPQPATSPRATVSRPAMEPPQRAPTNDARNAQQQRQLQEQAQERTRAQQEGQQRAREQQATQQRNSQLQTEQRSRAQAGQQQAAQQRQAQAEQRSRQQAEQQQAAQMQQQREVQQQQAAQMQQQREVQQQRQTQMQQREVQQQRQQQVEQQREAQQQRQAQQERAMQMQSQQRAAMQQRQQQTREREQPRPQPRERSESDHHDSDHHHPPPSSDDRNR